MISLSASGVAVAVGVTVGGTAEEVLLVVAGVALFPAAFTGMWMTLMAALVGHDDRDVRVRRAARRVLLCAWCVGVLAACVGVFLYVRSPEVATYQASTLLIWPAFVAVLIKAHRLLTRATGAATWLVVTEWVAAVALALGGGVGYAINGGAQWWSWGQFAVIPVVLMVIARGVRQAPARIPGASRQPWLGGYRDGPWGPP